jgi:GMP synthase (glutamine-hydrolysing)
MEKILILDFGSQYTQLIARRVRECHVYCEIHPYYHLPEWTTDIKAVILSGSPSSVNDTSHPDVDLSAIPAHLPILGICYGAQLMAAKNGGSVAPGAIREYGRAHIKITATIDPIFNGVENSQVWMSHGDSILKLPENYQIIAITESIPIAAYKHTEKPIYGLQFHPEVTHSTDGARIISNFVHIIAGCGRAWNPESFIETTVAELKHKLGNDQVVMGLSGGVDSSVAAVLLHKAIGQRLHCIFVDNGLLRKDEYEQVLESYRHIGLNIHAVKAANKFYEALAGIADPEAKRKAIGRVFIEVFDAEAKRINNVQWLGQGTIYPDVIESVSVKGPSATIKSHHNVGGLPEKMHLKVVEPIRTLFKDEVRHVGKALGIDDNILGRHPFPGPGLAIRILGEVNAERVQLLQQADHIFISALKESGHYQRVWQAGVILLPVKAVGVMGDERTYEHVVALRAVHSTDGMTADWVDFPHHFLAEVSNAIINRVKGINRVVYDISSKPPATIEWE